MTAHYSPEAFFYSFFLDLYDYDEEDITIIIDDGLPYNIQPTEENVVGVHHVVSL